MTASTFSFNPPLHAKEITGHEEDGRPTYGPDLAVVGILAEPESGAGQLVVVGPTGQIEWRDPTTIEIFIQF